MNTGRFNKEESDFGGWATKIDLLCTDGRIIRDSAFKHNDGKIVPIVWNHVHNDPTNILGKALLEHRDEGIYAYGKFNNTKNALHAKELVQHRDINGLSIFANGLKQHGNEVLHGDIKEVSLVLAGANPGAFIDDVMIHGEESESSCVIFTGENLELSHSDEKDKEDKSEKSDDKNKTVKDIIDSMTEEQKDALYYCVGQTLGNDEDSKEDKESEEKEMKHNVFDQTDENNKKVLSHSDMVDIINDAKRYGSMKESFLQHTQTYGIENIDYLFPDAKTVTNAPTFISRNMEWVKNVMASVHHTPFSRIKTVFADITEDEARARGYIKGKEKKEEVFSLLKRTTTPTTVYKKQKLDRDDLVDITDFNVVTWLKSEMRMMLDEELARAMLIGDGRLASSDDKINETNIRPVWTDDDLYTVKAEVAVDNGASDDEKAKAFIRNAIKSRKKYKGSGNPTLYTTEDVVTSCLLLEDTTGRMIYDTIDKLKTVLRVKEIVTVESMEGLTRKYTPSGSTTEKTVSLLGLLVNMNDYNVGADKGGEVNLFDDFDIDYNAQKYLIETRCSGALVKPYSAIAFELYEKPKNTTQS